MFRQWIAQAKVTDDPVGDFIGDFKADRKAPDDFESLDRLQCYLRLKTPVPRRSKQRARHGSVIRAGRRRPRKSNLAIKEIEQNKRKRMK